MTQRELKLGAILAGVGTSANGWQSEGLAGDESVDIDWYIGAAKQAEAAKFDFVFIVDSPYITPDSAPHFLNRLEPLTLLSAVAALGRIYVGPLTGTLVAAWGWPTFFAFAALTGIPGLLLVVWLRDPINFTEQQGAGP